MAKKTREVRAELLPNYDVIVRNAVDAATDHAFRSNSISPSSSISFLSDIGDRPSTYDSAIGFDGESRSLPAAGVDSNIPAAVSRPRSSCPQIPFSAQANSPSPASFDVLSIPSQPESPVSDIPSIPSRPGSPMDEDHLGIPYFRPIIPSSPSWPGSAFPLVQFDADAHSRSSVPSDVPSIPSRPESPVSDIPSIPSRPGSPMDEDQPGIPSFGLNILSSPSRSRSTFPQMDLDADANSPSSVLSSVPSIPSRPDSPISDMPSIPSRPRSPTSDVPSILSRPQSPASDVPSIPSRPESPAAKEDSSERSIPSIGSRPPSQPQSRLQSPFDSSCSSSPGIPSVGSRPPSPTRRSNLLTSAEHRVGSACPSPAGPPLSGSYMSGSRFLSSVDARATEGSSFRSPREHPPPPLPEGLFPRPPMPFSPSRQVLGPRPAAASMSVSPARRGVGSTIPISINRQQSYFAPRSLSLASHAAWDGRPMAGPSTINSPLLALLLKLNVAGLPDDQVNNMLETVKQGASEAGSFLQFLETVEESYGTYAYDLRDAVREVGELIQRADDDPDY